MKFKVITAVATEPITRAEAKLKIPTDVNLVMDWARKNSYPEPGVGESMDAYKTRIERNLIERRPEAYA